MKESFENRFDRRKLLKGAAGGAIVFVDAHLSLAESLKTPPTEHGSIDQTPKQKAELQAVIDAYKSYTLAQAKADGYIPDGDCITGEEIGVNKKGSMGYHAENPKLADTLDPKKPSTVIYSDISDERATPIAIEWEVAITSENQKPPTLFGVEFGFMEGHRMGDGNGGEMQMPEHYHLHVPVVDNSYGPLAMTNPNVDCVSSPDKMSMETMQGMDPAMQMPNP